LDVALKVHSVVEDARFRSCGSARPGTSGNDLRDGGAAKAQPWATGPPPQRRRRARAADSNGRGEVASRKDLFGGARGGFAAAAPAVPAAVITAEDMRRVRLQERPPKD